MICIQMQEPLIAITLSYLDTNDVIKINRSCKELQLIATKYARLFVLNEYNNTLNDNDLKLLKGVHTINLSDCTRITDKGLESLKGVHTIDLYNCRGITDKGLESLKGAHTIYLYNCKGITDKGLELLKGVMLHR